MRAAVQTGYGVIETSIEVRDVPTPTPGAGEVVVRVAGTTLNRKDLFALARLTGPGTRPRPPLPHVNSRRHRGLGVEGRARARDRRRRGDRV